MLYIEPFTSLTVTRVSASDTETDVTDSYRAIPESGRVEALARVQADRGDTFRFDYVCGWAADAIPAEVREQILGTIGYIARFRGETTTNDQFIKRVPLCHSSYRRATMQSPSWIIMTGAVVA